ncbi:MAG: GNAT family N-acetyltransferase [Deltaproteobacteria bacterium]|jgi:ribosomal protein S18 acetylase RimI-like enzyme|nr:GNAT family N-acetyltransferase [Deltaproteobacteria bacterium]
MIRKVETRDVNQVVAVHLSSFSGFFLSSLGPKFLALFYSGIISAPEGIAFVYQNEQGTPAGFVAGSSNPGGFYSRLLKQSWFKFAMAAVMPVLRKPSVILRVARAVFHPAANPVGRDVAGLFSIGVLPELQGSGAGKKLVQAFLDEVRRRGCKRVFLTTDCDHNDAVNAFYKKLGFSIERQFVTPEGRRMNEYWITLSEKNT